MGRHQPRDPIWIIPRMLIPTSTNAHTSVEPRDAKWWFKVRAEENALIVRARTRGRKERILDCGGPQDLEGSGHRNAERHSCLFIHFRGTLKMQAIIRQKMRTSWKICQDCRVRGLGGTGGMIDHNARHKCQPNEKIRHDTTQVGQTMIASLGILFV